MKAVRLSDKYVKHEIVHEDGSVDDEIEIYLKDAWKNWKHLCGKTYDSEEEEEYRFGLWKE
jgi:hypothetical protein